MKDTRPVNLEFKTLDLPVTAYASILHRVSGVIAVATVAALLWLLDLSLASEAGFVRAGEFLGAWWIKAPVWLLLVALIYHSSAGVRHLIMDLGYGESYEAGATSSRIVFAVTAVLAIIVGVWLW